VGVNVYNAPWLLTVKLALGKGFTWMRALAEFATHPFAVFPCSHTESPCFTSTLLMPDLGLLSDKTCLPFTTIQAFFTDVVSQSCVSKMLPPQMILGVRVSISCFNWFALIDSALHERFFFVVPQTACAESRTAKSTFPFRALISIWNWDCCCCDVPFTQTL